MPRTATTVGTLHKGGDELIFGPSTAFAKQLASFRALTGTQSHAKYSAIQYQESDQPARILRLRTPKDQDAHTATRAEEQKRFDESVALQRKKDAAAAQAAKPKPLAETEAHKAELESRNKAALSDPLRGGQIIAESETETQAA